MSSIGEVPRSELRRINEKADDDAELAERLAAAVFNMTHEPDEAEWYDDVDEDTGTKAEVKSAHLEVGDDYEAPGRFRVWRSQIRSLISSRNAGDSGTTWVIFVLFDEDQPVAIRRMHAETVLRIVKDRGGWNESGHEEFDEQHKIPIDAVFSGR